MGVVLKRAKHFLTCSGKFYGEKTFTPEVIKNQILQINDGIQMSMFDEGKGMLLSGKERKGTVLKNG